MLDQIGGDVHFQAGISTVALGRAAEPGEIAEAAVFRASSRASLHARHDDRRDRRTLNPAPRRLVG